MLKKFRIVHNIRNILELLLLKNIIFYTFDFSVIPLTRPFMKHHTKKNAPQATKKNVMSRDTDITSTIIAKRFPSNIAIRSL